MYFSGIITIFYTCMLINVVHVLLLIFFFTDPRTRNWFLLNDSPIYVTLIILCYIAIVRIGPKLMKNREPFKLQGFMIVYNTFLVILSAYMCVEVSDFDNDKIKYS